MHTNVVPLILAALLVLAATPSLTKDTTGQSLSSNVEVVEVRVENATYHGEVPATVTATVHNDGGRSATGVLQFRYNNTARSLTGDARSEQPISLAAGETRNVSIDWSPQQDQVGDGTVLAIFSNTGQGSGQAQGSTVVFVRAYELSATVVDDQGQQTLPGRSTPYRVSVENRGNTATTLWTNVTANATQDWTFDLHQGLVIDPGQNRTVVVLVAPPDADADELPEGSSGTASVVLAAQEQLQTNTTVHLPETTVVRDPIPPFSYGVAVTVLQDVAPISPNATSTVPVEVTNTGSEPDAFNLTIAAGGPLTTVLTVETGDQLIALGPNETRTVPVQLFMNDSAATGDAANVTLDARSVNLDPFEPDAHGSDWLTVRVAAPDLAIADLRAPPAVYRDQGTAALTLTAENRGQGPSPPTHVRVEVLRGGFAFVEGTAPVPGLSPGQNITVQAPVSVSDLSREYELRATIDPDDVVDENLEDNNLAAGDLHVRRAGLKVTPAEPLEVLPGQFVRYEDPPHVFAVRNLGDARERVTVAVTDQYGWVEDASTLVVAPGGRALVPVSFFVPEKPGTETDELTVRATLVNRSSITDANTSLTQITDRFPPELLGVDVPANVTATQPFTLTTRWSDAVGVASVTVHLESPANSTRSVELAAHGNGTFTGNLTVNELGRYALTLEAVDASSNENRFDHPDPFFVNASYDQPPALAFVRDEGQRVLSAGTPIELVVDEPVGITSVHYVASGAEGSIAEPFQVPTDGWTSGVHEVTVTATNRFDRTATIQGTFTIDNEPPVIERVRFDPAGPEPSEPVAIITAVAGGPSAVHAIVQDPSGQTLETVELSSTDGRAFEGTLQLPEGTYDVVVEARDAAGNQASQVQALQVGQTMISAPGLALVALVVGAVALVRVRRS